MLAISRRLAWLLLLVFLLVLGLLTITLSTQSGTGLLLDAARNVLPGQLTAGTVRGSLLGELQIDDFNYTDSSTGLEARLDSAQLRWQPGQLLQGRLAVEQLRVNGITLTLPTAGPADPNTGALVLPQLALPLDLRIEDVEIEDITVLSPGSEQPLIIEKVQLAAHSTEAGVHVDHARVVAPDVEVALTGDLSPTGDYPMALDVEWAVRRPAVVPLRGTARIEGALAGELQVEHQSEGLLNSALTLRLDQILSAPNWQFDVAFDSTTLDRLAPTLVGGTLKGRLNSQGGLEDFQLGGDAELVLAQTGPLDLQLELVGNQQELNLTQLKLAGADRPLSFNMAAQIDLLSRRLMASGEWTALGWPLTGSPQVSSPAGNFTVSGTLDQYQATLAAALSHEQVEQLDVALAVQGSPEVITITALTVTAPDMELAVQATGSLGLTDAMPVQMSADWQALAWPLRGLPQVVSPTGNITLSGEAKDYVLELAAGLDGPQFKPLQVTLTAVGTDQGLTLEQLVLRELQGDLQLNLKGIADFSSLGFDVKGHWQALSWPMVGKPQYSVPKGTLKAGGFPDDYQFSLTTAVDGSQVPVGSWHLEGQGSTRAIEALNITAETLGGKLDLVLSGAWQPQLSWQAEILGETLNPGLHWPQLAGDLNFNLTTEGQYQLPTAPPENTYIDALLPVAAARLPTASVQLTKLNGMLAGQVLSGVADIAIADDIVSVRALDLNAGSAKLQVVGQLAEQLKFDWQLAVPDLTRLLPSGSGSIAGKGTLQGSLDQPVGQLELNVDDLAYAGYTAQAFEVTAELDVSGEQASQIQVRGNAINMPGQSWDSLTIEGSGKPEQHTLTAQLTGDLGQYLLAAAGRFELATRQWQGQLDQLQALETLAGDWRLDTPAALIGSPQQADLQSPLCLRSEPTRLCISGGWSKVGGASGEIDLQQLNLDRLQVFLPTTLGLTNRVDATIKGARTVSGVLTADVDVNVLPARLRLENGGDVAEIDLAGLIQAEINNDKGNAELSIDLGGLGKVNGSAVLANLLSAPSAKGGLTAEINDLQLISLFVPQVQNVQGRLTADIDVDGELSALLPTGTVRLTGGSLEIPEAGAEITDLTLAATAANDGQLTLTGEADSAGGKLTVDGNYDLAGNQGVVTVTGDAFQVVNTREIKVLISPDLSIAKNDEGIAVTGELLIPKASLSPPKGAARSRVAASADVIIVKDGQQASDAGQALDLRADVKVVLGDDVNVSGFGFNGQLKGALRVEQQPQLAPRGSGTIEVVAGDYEIYGQQLTIERGRLLFSSGPLDNPGLDLRVTRTFDDVMAGADVRGNVRKPVLTLISDPTMAHSNILSYLVFGRPQSEASGSQNAMLFRAATALGTSGGNAFAKNISDAVGLDTLTLDGDSPEETSLVMGKYLSPDLYVSYGLGIFDAVNTFSLRYSISDRLSLESSASSKASSADLFYTID